MRLLNVTLDLQQRNIVSVWGSSSLIKVQNVPVYVNLWVVQEETVRLAKESRDEVFRPRGVHHRLSLYGAAKKTEGNINNPSREAFLESSRTNPRP